jgi:hypothetical protein
MEQEHVQCARQAHSLHQAQQIVPLVSVGKPLQQVAGNATIVWQAGMLYQATKSVTYVLLDVIQNHRPPNVWRVYQEDFPMCQALSPKMHATCAQLVSIPTLEPRNASHVLKVECRPNMDRQNVLHASMEQSQIKNIVAVRNAKLGESRCLVQQSALHVMLVLSHLRRVWWSVPHVQQGHTRTLQELRVAQHVRVGKYPNLVLQNVLRKLKPNVRQAL